MYFYSTGGNQTFGPKDVRCTTFLRAGAPSICEPGRPTIAEFDNSFDNSVVNCVFDSVLANDPGN